MTTLLFPAQGVQIIGTCMSLTTPGFGGFTLIILFIKLAASVMPRAHVFIVRSILPVHTKMLKRCKIHLNVPCRCAPYDVWHLRIRKLPFPYVHTNKTIQLFQVSTLGTVFGTYRFWCPKTPLSVDTCIWGLNLVWVWEKRPRTWLNFGRKSLSGIKSHFISGQQLLISC